ncbi:MAG: tetratricopeptide repeat protein, partial [Candidatus Omnitrophica bacterium]|nr:tetratricopeptide repeat protein [Candidatus Omnitrophota bacterium]
MFISDLQAQILAEGASSSLNQDKAPSNDVYDLKSLIRKSKENIRNVNDKIKEQAVRERNQQREQKAHEYYEQGQKLTEEGRLDDARAYYEQAIKITEHPEMKDYIKESETRRKRTDAALAHEQTAQDRRRAEEARLALHKIASMYDQAVSFYKEQRFKEAKEQFLLVEEISPDYKAVKCYLQIVDQDLRQSERQAMKDQRPEMGSLENKGEGQPQKQASDVEWVVPDFKSSRSYLKPADAVSATLTKSEAVSLISTDEIVRRNVDKENAEKRMLEADQSFTLAMDFYRKGQLIEAKEKFIAADQNVPDYKSSRMYLKRVDDDIAALVMAKRKGNDLATQRQDLDRLKEIRDRAESVYSEAMTAYDKKEYEKAKSGFQEVETIYPNYKKAAYYLGGIDEDIKRYQQQIAREKLEKEAERIYVQAVSFYGSEQFEEAKKKFIDLAAILPDYKQTTFYLDRIDDDIIRKKEKTLNDVRQRRAELLYNQATSLYQNTDYQQAKAKFLELEVIFPNYKDSTRYLTTIDQDILRKKQEQEERVKADQAEDVYKQALALYNAGNFQAAKDKFIRIEVIYPDYKDTFRYLSGIDGDIERRRKEDELRSRVNQAEP